MVRNKFYNLSILKRIWFRLSKISPLWISVLTFLFLEQSCAPAISPRIKNQVSPGLTFQKVLGNPESFVGKTVFWGGIILSTKNQEDGTVIEVIQVPLNYSDRPVDDISTTRGRFLIHTTHFLDSEVYKKGKDLTVVGIIKGKMVKKIGEFRYSYPLLEPLEIKLWKPLPKYTEYPPFYYDPFYYDPFFYDPFYYRPFHRPYPWRHYPYPPY